MGTISALKLGAVLAILVRTSATPWRYRPNPPPFIRRLRGMLLECRAFRSTCLAYRFPAPAPLTPTGECRGLTERYAPKPNRCGSNAARMAIGGKCQDHRWEIVPDSEQPRLQSKVLLPCIGGNR